MPKSNLTAPCVTQERPASRRRQRDQRRYSAAGNGLPTTHVRLDMDALGKVISDFVLQVLSLVAHSERENKRKRQAEGIAAAKANGIRFGREPKPLPQDFPEICKQWKKGLISISEAARRCGMARSTFLNRAAVFGKTRKS